jgi:hypothetical protein
MQHKENILFTFWKALEVLRRHSPAPGPSPALREALRETLTKLVERCSGCMTDHVLLAQTSCMVAELYPHSIFLGGEECAGICSDSTSRNLQVKNTALKLIQGHILLIKVFGC